MAEGGVGGKCGSDTEVQGGGGGIWRETPVTVTPVLPPSPAHSSLFPSPWPCTLA